MTPSSRRKAVVRALAWGSVIGSFPVWFSAFLVVPFLPLSVGERAVLAAVLIGAGEVMFWGAGLVLGAEALARFRPPKVDTGESFRGRRVVVVGATGGLGEAVVRALVREGAEVVLVARDGARLARLAGACGAAHHTAELAAPQLRDVAARVGPVDHVVCATGVDVRKGLDAHTDQEVELELAVDLAGPIHVARAFLPRLRPGGVIALFGGFGDGTLALPYYSVDVAARAGLAGFCSAVNRELAAEGRAEVLCYVGPAPADTAAERPFADLWRRAGSALAPPEKVADFVLAALLARKTRAVMGASTRLLLLLQALAPPLADLVIARRIGPHLRHAFGASGRASD
ncbi:SDR family NAD(P)-dependent oxidoreductase [Sorangium sp. So ce341]|uniref:SDR family NAD(P)-dependent oxidoreductase n=1 Tax=Sorangium sp. So ce341 TaxID=3133302 RepID=UPI003F625B01